MQSKQRNGNVKEKASGQGLSERITLQKVLPVLRIAHTSKKGNNM